jgi:hypothetical protein
MNKNEAAITSGYQARYLHSVACLLHIVHYSTSQSAIYGGSGACLLCDVEDHLDAYRVYRTRGRGSEASRTYASVHASSNHALL